MHDDWPMIQGDIEADHHTRLRYDKEKRRIVREREMTAQPWRLHLIVAWYDAWVGAFWDGEKRRLYLFPVPCVGLRIDFPRGGNR